MTSNYTPDMLQCYPGSQTYIDWTMHLIICVVVEGLWCSYEYSTTPFHECDISHGSRLTGVDHPTDHIMTSNYTLDMLSCYPDTHRRAWTMDLSSGVGVQWWWWMSGYTISVFYDCYISHVPPLKRGDHPRDNGMTSDYTPNMLNCYSGFRIGDPEQCTSSVV